MKVGFWNRLAKNFDQQDVVDPAIVTLIKAHLEKESQVLEIGAGTGNLALQLAPFCQSLEASDFSPDMVAKAQEKAHPGNLRFSIQDGAQLSFGSESFDVVVGMNVLHVVSDIEQVVTELSRVLRPEGVLIIQVPTFKEQQFVSIITRMTMQMMKFRLWPVASYENLLKDKGFMIELSQETRSGSLSVVMIAKKISLI